MKKKTSFRALGICLVISLLGVACATLGKLILPLFVNRIYLIDHKYPGKLIYPYCEKNGKIISKCKEGGKYYKIIIEDLTDPAIAKEFERAGFQCISSSNED